MGITSLQVCMDSASDWLQGTISDGEGAGMDNSSSSPITAGDTPSGEDMLACSRPLIERRLRPQHEQALKCPRCESTHTKFCYYNNYSLSQPRYFCKTCRRYWTKGGTLRNIPVGGGCRKNKKVSSSSKKPSSSHENNSNNNSHSPISSTTLILNAQNSIYNNNNNNNSNFNNPTELQLAFPEMPFSLFNTGNLNPSFLLDHTSSTPVDYMDNKYEALVGAGSHDFLGNAENFGGGIINMTSGLMAANSNLNFHGVSSSPFMFDQFGSSSSNGNNILESCQRLMIGPSSYDNHHQHHHFDQNNNDHVDDVKPNAKILSLEWNDNGNNHHQQACNSDACYNFGGLGSWSGLMNGYEPSVTNPLV